MAVIKHEDMSSNEIPICWRELCLCWPCLCEVATYMGETDGLGFVMTCSEEALLDGKAII